MTLSRRHARRPGYAQRAGRAILLAVGACALVSVPAQAGDAQMPVNVGAARASIQVNSVRALRDAGVVKQRYDYSCGAASLATLLSFGLDDPVDEDWVLKTLLEPLSSDELGALQKKGLSLLDLQKLAQIRGHKAQGFRLAADQLARLKRPVIVFIKPGGYEHFAVFRGVRGDRVHVADPSLGNVRMPLYRFLDMWADASGRGVIFAVERQDGTWPDRYALQVADDLVDRSETAALPRLLDSAKPLPTTNTNR